MATIIIADDGIAFDGRTAEIEPLGGAESAVVGLAQAFAARGHDVAVFTKTTAPVTHRGVAWRPLDGGLPDDADLYVANRGDKLLRLVPRARRRVFWIHNPARYLRKWRFVWKLAWQRPTIVFSGAYHASTCPSWIPGPRLVIPLGIEEIFRHARERPPPAPRAVFTSNPLRGLDWLLDMWVERIRPAAPTAQLHVFSGAAPYGAVGAAKEGAMTPILERAAGLGAAGVVMRGTVSKARLAEELQRARVYLYRGDPGETFCLSAAEAQASGLPGVVQDIGSLSERILDRETGFVTGDADSFAAAAAALLGDDALWLQQHRAALQRQRGHGWSDAAATWEAAFLAGQSTQP